ncbi:hypothetical protein FGO68_gene12054 [Halteria grandinella]|uniref:Uncharacterized protein n=1 Tax=Halteria grandinella TaxID=5974 RepID=A0A8J8NH89_HALGN|nr:hypothetical protein FGO68_gene12054 [Halteria grandinella]
MGDLQHIAEVNLILIQLFPSLVAIMQQELVQVQLKLQLYLLIIQQEFSLDLQLLILGTKNMFTSIQTILLFGHINTGQMNKYYQCVEQDTVTYFIINKFNSIIKSPQ